MGKKLSKIEQFELRATAVEDKITKELSRLEGDLISEVDTRTRQIKEIQKRIKEGENRKKPSQIFSNLLDRYITTKKSIATTCKAMRVLTRALYNIKDLRRKIRMADVFKDVAGLVKSTNSKLKEISEKQIDDLYSEFEEIIDKDSEINECLRKNSTTFEIDPEELEHELEELVKEDDNIAKESAETIENARNEVSRKTNEKKKKTRKKKSKGRKGEYEMSPLLQIEKI